MAREPRLSWCTTHLNSWPAVREFVESTWAGLGPDDELIVVDGGSTDASRDFLTAFAQDHPDRFRLESRPGANRGQGREQAWRMARGDTIVILDADRRWAPEGMARLRTLVKAHPGDAMTVVSRQEGRSNGGVDVIPRGQLEAIDGYDTSLTYFEDHDLHDRLDRIRRRTFLYAPLFDLDWKGKMKRPHYLVRYYYEMFRDGARMGLTFGWLVSGMKRRPLSWPFAFIGLVGFLVGRRRPKARSRQAPVR